MAALEQNWSEWFHPGTWLCGIINDFELRFIHGFALKKENSIFKPSGN